MTEADSDLVNLCHKIIEKIDGGQCMDFLGDELLTREQVAKRICVSKNTLRAQIEAGGFPEPVIIAGQERWPVKMINAFIAQTNTHIQQLMQVQTDALKAIRS